MKKINLYTEYILELKSTNKKFSITNLIKKIYRNRISKVLRKINKELKAIGEPFKLPTNLTTRVTRQWFTKSIKTENIQNKKSNHITVIA